MRAYITNDLSANIQLVLPDSVAHHICTVMRRQVGDMLQLFNGRDGEYTATISTIRGKKVTVQVQQQTRVHQPCLPVTLWFAPLKKDAGDFLVQKATEMGIAQLRPVFTHYTNSQRVNIERWQAIAIGAAEQCRLLSVPTVHEAVSFAQMLPLLQTERVMFCDEKADMTAYALCRLQPQVLPAHIVIGPEGGFSTDEQHRLQQLPHHTSVCLGERILRAETAAVVALALWQAVYYGI